MWREVPPRLRRGFLKEFNFDHFALKPFDDLTHQRVTQGGVFQGLGLFFLLSQRQLIGALRLDDL